MANTYTQMYIHFVFAVQNRQSLILTEWEDELYKYITGIVQNNGHKMLSINGMPDHIHIFIGYKPKHPMPKLVEEIKTSSNKFIKNSGFTPYKFSWQEGYSGFSYGRSQISLVGDYIDNQKRHHKKMTFKEEYLGFLKNFEIEYKEQYLFDFMDLKY